MQLYRFITILQFNVYYSRKQTSTNISETLFAGEGGVREGGSQANQPTDEQKEYLPRGRADY